MITRNSLKKTKKWRKVCWRAL